MHQGLKTLLLSQYEASNDDCLIKIAHVKVWDIFGLGFPKWGSRDTWKGMTRFPEYLHRNFRMGRSSIPRTLFANVQSLENELSGIRVRAPFHRDMRDCNILCLTKTCSPRPPSHAIWPAESFSIFRMDRTEESNTLKAGESVS